MDMEGDAALDLALSYRNIDAPPFTRTRLYLRKAQTIYEDDDDRLINLFIEFAQTEYQSNNHSEAHNYLNKAIALCQRFKIPQQHKYQTEIYTLLGQIYTYQKQYPKAEKAFDQALNTFNDFAFTTIQRITPLEEKAQLLTLMNDNAAAYRLYQQLDTLYSQTSYQLKEDKSKFRLAERAFSMYGKAIKTTLKLFEKRKDSKDSTYLNAAFIFCDKSKSIVFRQAITDSRAKKFVGIDDSLLQQERLLKSTVAYLERQIEQDTTKEMRQKFSEAKDTLRRFIKNLEKKYPNYHKLKYAITPLSISDIQGQLPDSMLFISYFLGDKDLTTFAISRQQSRVYTMPITAQFDTTLEHFIRSLKTTDITAKNDYLQHGLTLYQKLLKNPLKDLNPNNTFKRLRIIPDGKLNYLSFEALIDSSALNWKDEVGKKVPFLIRKYAFSYDYFADSLKSQVVAGNFAGFGLDYTSPKVKQFGKHFLDSTKLTTLPHAKTELDAISQTLSRSDKVWFNDEATKNKFLNHAQNIGIAHIVAHTITDDKHPFEFGIVLSPEKDSNDRVLRGHDLLSTSMTAQLVTLSACKTGDGVLKKGEGVMSLAKAFSFIGCESLVMTLWSIPDISTAQIMPNFYKNLSSRDSKDIALQKAKLAYLDNPNPWSDGANYSQLLGGFCFDWQCGCLRHSNFGLMSFLVVAFVRHGRFYMFLFLEKHRSPLK